MIDTDLLSGRTLVGHDFVTTGIPSIIPATPVAVAVSVAVAVAGLTVITSASVVTASGVITTTGVIPSPSGIISPGIEGILPGVDPPVRPGSIRTAENKQKTRQADQKYPHV
jgi:hypothetical protein